jgi:hypothetical protein
MAQLQQMAEALKQALAKPGNSLSPEMKKTIGELAAATGAGKMSAEELRRRAEELKKKLAQSPCPNCGGSCTGGQCQGLGTKPGMGPGRGGISRGRGDAELTFGDQQRADGARFQDEVLATTLSDANDLVDLGMTRIEPKPDPGRFAPGALRQFEANPGAQVTRTRISPSQ